ncbi:hypothetical protein CPT_Moabite_167 [Serratia phage Moabite]|uniref:Uncharacterized protein n=3 Tax=Moabitevirus TaxID=2843422 RepID=A0A7T3NBI5_9CAUD|nr:hypothetical protein HWB23_gp084 [Serratia phage vB_SmaM_ 2050HW]YP_009849261.1 hypothetical protein HWC48_gp249 [Serratia phage Moabite]QPX76657.1 hypothetical protein [Serratia phage vB_SmaM_Yaphecito]UCR74696.1 hypothetical protein [Serratia phage BUCT660]UGO54052.1 hypothetical protein HAYMO_70 [Serratia phage vB_SmaM_Haymo]UQT03561.1 hypothetical protein KODAMA_00940 [Serratia phage vB_SmaM-Kodama]URG14264.1 hypothetical protein [Pectobacterium phage vB_ParM-25]
MSGYEKVETFEEVKEGEFQSSRVAEGFPGNDDDRLEFTQSIRMMAVNQLVTDGKVPTDKDSINSLSKLLDGIDKQVIGKKRIQVADKANENDERIAHLLEEMSTRVVRGETPIESMYAGKPTRDDKVFSLNMAAEFDDIDDSELVIDKKEESSSEFFERMENAHEDLRKG